MNDVQTLDQFNLLNEQIYHDNLLLQLTNYRKLGNKHEQVKQSVLLGYYKINNLINRRLVREAASKRLVIQ
jgi:hypothetical protein